jgi:glutaredoxin
MPDKIILDKILKNNTFIVFYEKTCPYCVAALDELRRTKSRYKGYEINNINLSFNQLLNIFKKHPELNFDPKHKTVPIVFYNGKFLGGYTELINFLDKK